MFAKVTLLHEIRGSVVERLWFSSVSVHELLITSRRWYAKKFVTFWMRAFVFPRLEFDVAMPRTADTRPRNAIVFRLEIFPHQCAKTFCCSSGGEHRSSMR